MTQRALKTGWHLIAAILAVVEIKLSTTPFRKNVCGACAGWHFAAAIGRLE